MSRSEQIAWIIVIVLLLFLLLHLGGVHVPNAHAILCR